MKSCLQEILYFDESSFDGPGMVKKKKSSITSSKYASSLLRTLGIVIAVIGILTYIRTIGYDYALDDFSIIKENRVTTMGVSGITTIFKTPYRYGYDIQGDQLYRPVPKSVFAILWSIAPANPMPAHLLNVLLYGLTGFPLIYYAIEIDRK
jgi:hypothetical protein